MCRYVGTLVGHANIPTSRAKSARKMGTQPVPSNFAQPTAEGGCLHTPLIPHQPKEKRTLFVAGSLCNAQGVASPNLSDETSQGEGFDGLQSRSVKTCSAFRVA